MRCLLLLLALLIGIRAAEAGGRHWDLSDPTVAELAKNFQQPPPEYGLTLWWGWNGPVTREVIQRDLDAIKGYGFTSVMIEAGSDMTARYLSPEWFALFRDAVDEAARRDMRVWVEDEGKYPSGFVNGKFTRERPDLRMQALLAGERIAVEAGQTVTRELTSTTLCAVAVNLESGKRKLIEIGSGKLRWTAPAGRWEVQLASRDFRSGPTAWIDNPSRARKDNAASLCDYLNPEATRQILAWTHEGYKKALGERMGTTFMGLMGDEPGFSYTPWTPKMIEEFQKRKGHDVRPWLPAIASRAATPEAMRARADYWDVWSDLFAENYFKIIADWAEASGVEYIVHLDKDDENPQSVLHSGDFMKAMRNPQGPGIDVIWAQIWPDHEADYPKMASSASHLFGRARAFSESFAAFTNPVDVPIATWVMNYQLARGINQLQVMMMGASTRGPRAGGRRSFFASPEFPAVARAMQRVSYLLSMGRPAAQIGVLVPTTSLWLGDKAADASNLAIAKALLGHQRDFDWLDERSLASEMTLQDGAFINRSGQRYRAVIVPAVSAISKGVLDRLREFAGQGGRVIFAGKAPGLVVEKSFLHASATPPDIRWARSTSADGLTSAALSFLPPPDVALAEPAPAVKYQHRHMRDGDVYFLFNEGTEKVATRVKLLGTGEAQAWGAASGRISKVEGSIMDGGYVEAQLTLEPHGTQLIILGPHMDK